MASSLRRAQSAAKVVSDVDCQSTRRRRSSCRIVVSCLVAFIIIIILIIFLSLSFIDNDDDLMTSIYARPYARTSTSADENRRSVRGSGVL
jgi:hypothetical protein